MYRYVGTAGGGGHLLRDAGDIAAELTALRGRLADALAHRREIEEKQAVLEGACRRGESAGVVALEELAEELWEVREDILAISEDCDVLREELCEALYLARGTRVS